MPDRSPNSESPNFSRHEALRYYVRKLQRHPAISLGRDAVRTVRSAGPASWRFVTRRFRQLPSVVIVGAQKAGTTQLFAYLARHPRLFTAVEKEVNYFSLHADRPVEWYQSRFPLRRKVAAVGGITIDAPPSYLPNPSALRLMRSVLPEAKLIAVLRDPVSRAFSHFQHAKSRGREPRSFEQAVEDEIALGFFSPKFGVALQPDAAAQLGYVARGYYALQLELVFALFPQEQTLIIDSAELFDDTCACCQRVFSFLALEPCDVQPGKIYNRGYYKEKIDPLVAERLRQHYLPYDELLVQLLGHSFRWMKAAQPLAA